MGRVGPATAVVLVLALIRSAAAQEDNSDCASHGVYTCRVVCAGDSRSRCVRAFAAGVEWWLALIIVVGAIALVVALGYLMYKHHLHQQHHHGTKHHVTRKASVERAVRRASKDVGAARKYSADPAQANSAVVHVQPSTRDLS